MEGNSGKKGRLLFLAKYLMEQTDDQNAVTVEDLIRVCEERGYTVNRNSERLAQPLASVILLPTVTLSRWTSWGWSITAGEKSTPS